MRCVTLCASLLVLAVASPAVAQKANFGGGGQIVLDGVIDVDYEIRRPPRGDSTATTGVTLAPGILYFVADDIAVGGNVLLDVSRSDPDDTLSFGIQPVVAYNVRLTPGVSMLPNGWMAYRSSSIEVFGLDRETRRISVGIELPFLVHLVPHFFIGGGPYASYDLWAKSVTGSTSSDADKVADFGVRSVIGGWF
jgi:hypothetical protein